MNGDNTVLLLPLGILLIVLRAIQGIYDLVQAKRKRSPDSPCKGP